MKSMTPIHIMQKMAEKIGKAKVLHGVVTYQEAFAWLNNKIETR